MYSLLNISSIDRTNTSAIDLSNQIFQQLEVAAKTPRWRLILSKNDQLEKGSIFQSIMKKIRELLSYGKSAHQDPIENKLISIIKDGAKLGVFETPNLDLIRSAAQKVGLVFENKKSEKDHEVLAHTIDDLVNALLTKSLEAQKKLETPVYSSLHDKEVLPFVPDVSDNTKDWKHSTEGVKSVTSSLLQAGLESESAVRKYPLYTAVVITLPKENPPLNEWLANLQHENVGWNAHSDFPVTNCYRMLCGKERRLEDEGEDIDRFIEKILLCAEGVESSKYKEFEECLNNLEGNIGFSNSLALLAAGYQLASYLKTQDGPEERQQSERAALCFEKHLKATVERNPDAYEKIDLKKLKFNPNDKISEVFLQKLKDQEKTSARSHSMTKIFLKVLMGAAAVSSLSALLNRKDSFSYFKLSSQPTETFDFALSLNSTPPIDLNDSSAIGLNHLNTTSINTSIVVVQKDDLTPFPVCFFEDTLISPDRESFYIEANGINDPLEEEVPPGPNNTAVLNADIDLAKVTDFVVDIQDGPVLRENISDLTPDIQDKISEEADAPLKLVTIQDPLEMETLYDPLEIMRVWFNSQLKNQKWSLKKISLNRIHFIGLINLVVFSFAFSKRTSSKSSKTSLDKSTSHTETEGEESDEKIKVKETPTLLGRVFSFTKNKIKSTVLPLSDPANLAPKLSCVMETAKRREYYKKLLKIKIEKVHRKIDELNSSKFLYKETRLNGLKEELSLYETQLNGIEGRIQVIRRELKFLNNIRNLVIVERFKNYLSMISDAVLPGSGFGTKLAFTTVLTLAKEANASLVPGEVTITDEQKRTRRSTLLSTANVTASVVSNILGIPDPVNLVREYLTEKN